MNVERVFQGDPVNQDINRLQLLVTGSQVLGYVGLL